MFGFAPKLPVSREEREWVEDSLTRLDTVFGVEVLASVNPLPPSDNHFPEWDGTEACLLPLLVRVCGLMQANPHRLTLETLPDTQRELRKAIPQIGGAYSGPMGLYQEIPAQEKTVIAVKESLLPDPVTLIATLAHEVAHARLLGEGLIGRDEPDREPLTDLCTLVWGFGIFGANAAFQFSQYGNGGRRGWSVRRTGYLPQEIWGFALAAWAARRCDDRAEWSRHLSTNVGAYFKSSRAVLRREAKAAGR